MRYENAQTSVRAPLFFDEMRGLLPMHLFAEEIAIAFYRTEDGGEIWSFHASKWMPGDTLRKLDFVSATTGWALTDLAPYRTEDGAKTRLKLGDYEKIFSLR